MVRSPFLPLRVSVPFHHAGVRFVGGHRLSRCLRPRSGWGTIVFRPGSLAPCAMCFLAAMVYRCTFLLLCISLVLSNFVGGGAATEPRAGRQT